MPGEKKRFNYQRKVISKEFVRNGEKWFNGKFREKGYKKISKLKKMAI